MSGEYWGFLETSSSRKEDKMSKQIVHRETRNRGLLIGAIDSGAYKTTVLDSEGNRGVGKGDDETTSFQNAVKDVNRKSEE
jgi:hypothetical protein